MVNSWNVLVVDDEKDIHSVTSLALKRKQWRGRPIQLTDAYSAKEAREILCRADAGPFQCALVDVVMETDNAGLELCDFIRSTMPRTMRIILRTGQPGSAPPEKTLNDYDIDYYLAKTEVTEVKLYETLRACFRSSLDIAALISVTAQLKALSSALQSASTTSQDLVAIAMNALKCLAEKHSAEIAFVPDLTQPSATLQGVDPGIVAGSIAKAHTQKLPAMQLLPGHEYGLPAGSFVVLTAAFSAPVRAQGLAGKAKEWVRGLLNDPNDAAPPDAGVVVRFQEELAPRTQREFLGELDTLLSNWKVADSALRHQDQLARQRMGIE